MSAIVLGGLVDGDALCVHIPTLVDTRALITGNSGAGKSRLLRRLAEQAFGKVQQIIIDPEGEFSTLRERHDFLLAGRGGEVPAEPRAAALLARRLMELRASAVLDLYDLKINEQRSFVRLFLEELLSLPRDQYRPVLLMIDEAHRYCPEKGHGEAESTGAVVDLMSQGRKRGLCGILASQRLSKVAKDAAAEVANAFIGRTTLDVDQTRAADALGLTTKAEKVALRDLDNGVFHAYGPATNHKGVVLFRGGDVLTTHPKAGQRHKVEAPAPPDAIRKLAEELKDLPAQAAEEIRTLQAAKARIRDLQQQLRARPVEKVERERTVTKRVEVPVLKDAQVKRLEAAVAGLDRFVDRSFEAVESARRMAQEIAVAIGEAARRDTQAAKASVPVVPGRGAAGLGPGQSPPATVVRAPRGNGRDASNLAGPEQRILDALAWLAAIGVKEPEDAAVAFLAGYTANGGAYRNPRGSLRAKGLIVYYSGGRLGLTEEGDAGANAPDAPLTNEELHGRVLARLPGPEGRILRPLLEAWPRPVEDAALAAAAGYTPEGGAYRNPKGRLRSLGLAEYPCPGQVRARDILFPESRA